MPKNSSIEEVNHLNAELAKAASEITTLKQMLNEARMAAAELKKTDVIIKFCIEAIRGSDKEFTFTLAYHLQLYLMSCWNT